mmetsp:Transcript_18774/g.33192  ORF Transcript_18774/g.33192 Transcript_18774/m.33192 type:complete len:328 (+) Transcript_18774:666-1649(+)
MTVLHTKEVQYTPAISYSGHHLGQYEYMGEKLRTIHYIKHPLTHSHLTQTLWHVQSGTVAAHNALQSLVRHKDLVGPQQICNVQLLLLPEADSGDVPEGQVNRVRLVKALSVTHNHKHLAARLRLLDLLNHGLGLFGARGADGRVQPVDNGDDAGPVLDHAGDGQLPLLLIDVLLVVPVVPGPKGHTTTPQQRGTAGTPTCITSPLLGIGLLASPTHLGTRLGVGVRLTPIGQLCNQLLVDDALAVHSSCLQVDALLPSSSPRRIHDANGRRANGCRHLTHYLSHPPSAGIQPSLNLSLVGSQLSLHVGGPAPVGEEDCHDGGGHSC